MEMLLGVTDSRLLLLDSRILWCLGSISKVLEYQSLTGRKTSMTSRSDLLRGIRKHTFDVVDELSQFLSSYHCHAEKQQASASEPLKVVAFPVTVTLRRWEPL